MKGAERTAPEGFWVDATASTATGKLSNLKETNKSIAQATQCMHHAITCSSELGLFFIPLLLVSLFVVWFFKKEAFDRC